MSVRQPCGHCGCERDSHYFDRVTRTYENCLVVRCNGCRRFVPEGTAKPPPPRPPHHPWDCECYYCKQHPKDLVEDDYIDEDPPPTPRFLPWP